MTRSHKLRALQVALVLASAAAFSSFSKSGVVIHTRQATTWTRLSNNYSEEQDSTMSKLIDALQNLDLNKREPDPAHGGGDDMPVLKDGMYIITSKEQHT